MRTRYAICGLSFRGIHHFILPLLGKHTYDGANDFSQTSEVCGIVDLDPKRVEAFFETFRVRIPSYPLGGFDQMIAETRPDVILVAGPDHTHFGWILKALRAGCDVIVEKPMVTTTRQAMEVLEAERETGRQVRVAFNYRYKPMQRELKRLLQSDAIGRITNLEFNYNLDTEHGASYFLRWNRQRAFSGSLAIHKLCHHFDLVNWWLDDVPSTAFAMGALNYYGENGAHRPRDPKGAPLPPRETRRHCPYFQKHFAGHGAKESGRIPSFWDRHALPYDAQYPSEEGNYLYDPEIDIEDTYGAVLRYRKGAILSYSVNFSAPWEGFTLGINGTLGRLETSYRVQMTPSPTDSVGNRAQRIRILPLFAEAYEVEIPPALGGHGGADEPLQRDLFAEISPESRALDLLAGSLAGAYAVAAGEAVWQSCASGEPITIPCFESSLIAL